MPNIKFGSKTFTDVEKINVPLADGTGQVSFGECAPKDIPTYLYEEAYRVSEKIENFKKTHTNYLVFGVISDNHVYANDETYEQLSKTSVLDGAFGLETVGAMVGCDFVANLGDNCWENGSDTENAYQGSLYTVNVTKPAHERLTSFSLVGNHDKNDNTQLIYDLIGQYNNFDVCGTTKIRNYGYKDFTDKKVRVIVLNTCDYLNASGGCALSYEQKDFLMRTLDLSEKTDANEWGIILLSHIPLDWNGGDYNFHTDLKNILDAYQNGMTTSVVVNNAYALNETPANYTTYSDGKLVYDYTGKNTAKIIANIHGHVHTDAYGKMADNNILRMATPNTCFYLGKTESYPNYGDYSIDKAIARVAGTPTETSATFYCVDLQGQTIYSYAYGAGNDRVASYKQATIYTVTYNLTNATMSDNTALVEDGEVFANYIRVNEGCELSGVVITMGGVDVTSSVYSSNAITIGNVTGNIVVTVIAKAATLYTNIIDTAGTEDNVRLRSGGNTASAAGFASGYFSVKAGDIIRVKFPNGNRASIPSNGMYCCLYSDDNGTVVAYYNDSTSGTVLKNATDTGYEIHIPSSVNCSYARVAGGANGQYEGWIVTVNEEITD